MYYLEKENMISFGNAKGRMIILDTRNWSLVRDFNAVNGPIWDNILFPNDSSLIVAGLDDFLTRWQIFDFPPKFLERPGPARRFNPEKEVSNGEKQFARKCSVCHTLKADGKKRAGPSLHKVFGRGKIINVQGIGDEAKITIIFSGNQIKKFVSKYANLVRL